MISDQCDRRIVVQRRVRCETGVTQVDLGGTIEPGCHSVQTTMREELWRINRELVLGRNVGFAANFGLEVGNIR